VGLEEILGREVRRLLYRATVIASTTTRAAVVLKPNGKRDAGAGCCCGVELACVIEKSKSSCTIAQGGFI